MSDRIAGRRALLLDRIAAKWIRGAGGEASPARGGPIVSAAGKAAITGIDASYYYTKDLGRASAFYARLFGFDPTLHVPQTVCEWTFGDGTTFGLYQPENAGEWRRGSGIMFHVEDIGAAVEAGKALGATFEEHQEETPVCFMAFGHDPDGNTFILHQPKPA
jgi:predicted enzyme related to lactoylglutathione lyase